MRLCELLGLPKASIYYGNSIARDFLSRSLSAPLILRFQRSLSPSLFAQLIVRLIPNNQPLFSTRQDSDASVISILRLLLRFELLKRHLSNRIPHNLGSTLQHNRPQLTHRIFILVVLNRLFRYTVGFRESFNGCARQSRPSCTTYSPPMTLRPRASLSKSATLKTHSQNNLI